MVANRRRRGSLLECHEPIVQRAVTAARRGELDARSVVAVVVKAAAVVAIVVVVVVVVDQNLVLDLRGGGDGTCVASPEEEINAVVRRGWRATGISCSTSRGTAARETRTANTTAPHARDAAARARVISATATRRDDAVRRDEAARLPIAQSKRSRGRW